MVPTSITPREKIVAKGKRTLGVDKMGAKMPRKIGQPTGKGNPGTTTYTGKPGVNKGKAK
jgi:hypothetical protein